MYALFISQIHISRGKQKVYSTRKRVFNFHCVPLQCIIYIARALDLCSARESATTIQVRVTTKRSALKINETTPIYTCTDERTDGRKPQWLGVGNNGGRWKVRCGEQHLMPQYITSWLMQHVVAC